MAANQSREQVHRIRAAVDADGTILAIDETLYHDQGAYVRTHGARVADMTIGLLLGPYRIPAYRAVAHFRVTNKTPAATYRAPGRFEGSFVRERLMDAIAAHFGIDRIEVRRRNLIGTAEMPYERGYPPWRLRSYLIPGTMQVSSTRRSTLPPGRSWRRSLPSGALTVKLSALGLAFSSRRADSGPPNWSR